MTEIRDTTSEPVTAHLSAARPAAAPTAAVQFPALSEADNPSSLRIRFGAEEALPLTLDFEASE